ncbi:MAG: DUF6776 family protein [Luteimonas sp.]
MNPPTDPLDHPVPSPAPPALADLPTAAATAALDARAEIADPPPPLPLPPPPPPPSPSASPTLTTVIAVAVLVALAFGAWGAWKTFAPAPADAATRLRQQAARIETLQQRVATLSRSDQISRDANRDVQGTLAERDEEIAALRADVAFYERFVGATGQRRGLTVHELLLLPQSDTAWHFTATLTQNLNRGAVSSGRAMLWVEGMQAGKLRRLAWTDLRQQANAPGIEYSFKYFQQVEGDIALPPGFMPLRVAVRLTPQGAAAVEQSFAWADAAQLPAAGT